MFHLNYTSPVSITITYMRHMDLPTERHICMQKWHTPKNDKKGTFEHGIIKINLTFISTLQEQM